MISIRRWWRQRSPRERLSLSLLGVVASGFLSYRIFLQPRSFALGSIKKQERSMQQSIAELQASLTVMDEGEKALEAFAAETALLHKEVERLEGLMPTQGDINKLLSLLADFGQDLDLEFQGIKQRLSADTAEHPQAPYGEVSLEVLLRSTYPALVYYLKRIEAISPLLRFNRMDVVESHKGGGWNETRLLLSMPVHRVPQTTAALTDVAVPKTPVIEFKRSLFGELHQPIPPSILKDIVVSGISVSPHGSTAIINGEVLRVGDPVASLVITEIQPNQVLLSDGAQTYSVMLK